MSSPIIQLCVIAAMKAYVGTANTARLTNTSQVPGQQDHDHANADPDGRCLHRRVGRGDDRHAGGSRDCGGHQAGDAAEFLARDDVGPSARG